MFKHKTSKTKTKTPEVLFRGFLFPPTAWGAEALTTNSPPTANCHALPTA